MQLLMWCKTHVAVLAINGVSVCSIVIPTNDDDKSVPVHCRRMSGPKPALLIGNDSGRSTSLNLFKPFLGGCDHATHCDMHKLLWDCSILATVYDSAWINMASAELMTTNLARCSMSQKLVSWSFGSLACSWRLDCGYRVSYFTISKVNFLMVAAPEAANPGCLYEQRLPSWCLTA